ncbi:MAG: indole-3-glycerol phosphate synthase TrpC [Oscillospiraceae bacterium]|nr:indole-3-glycerol phosphate synthase TrpC [Oscillospiraceae bacterium]
MTILDQLARHAEERVGQDKLKLSPVEIRRRARDCAPANGRRFREALSGAEPRFICEVKKASPSRGIIDPVFHYLDIAREYEAAGADAISCLTEPKWFLGSDSVFQEIRSVTALPMLRKDFVVDEYQLYQSKLMGADCILLICALLDSTAIQDFLGLCAELGLAALVETHNEEEIESAVSAGADIIGVNNRNLKDFSVDLSHASRLRGLIPADRLFVAESGLRTPEDAAMLRASGADAILVGEAMMRAPDKKAFLSALRGAADE